MTRQPNPHQHVATESPTYKLLASPNPQGNSPQPMNIFHYSLAISKYWESVIL